VLSTVAGMLLSFAFAWHGRDKIWTPTFKGERHVRFELAVRHYDERMGLVPATVLVTKRGRVVDGKERCAWSWRDTAWADDEIGFLASPRCNTHKPEMLALHEQCHRRMAHLEPAFWGLDAGTKERQAKACMVAYSRRERR